LQIHEILVRDLDPDPQIHTALTNDLDSDLDADPDPALDPAIFVSDLEDVKKKFLVFLVFLLITF
jgi:hypothetical protein